MTEILQAQGELAAPARPAGILRGGGVLILYGCSVSLGEKYWFLLTLEPAVSGSGLQPGDSSFSSSYSSQRGGQEVEEGS